MKRFSLRVLLGLPVVVAAMASEELRIQPRGPSESLVERLSEALDAEGSPVTVTNRYAELATGLNYLDGSEWKATDTTLEIEPGFAKAWKGQHKVAFASDINSEGSVAIEMPDGTRVTGQIYGLAYFNQRTGESVLIAGIKSCEAWITDPNRVLYVDAFEGFAADVRYTYTRDGLEQDVILRESPPAPSEFGWDPEDVRLEVWTEFQSEAEPKRLAKKVAVQRKNGQAVEIEDEEIGFGSMEMAAGKAFVLGSESTSLTLVQKRWESLDNGRSFLVESVAIESMATALDALPVPQKKEGASIRKTHPNRLQALRSLPRSKRNPEREQVLIPKLGSSEEMVAMNSRPGLVLDYQLNLTTGQTNYTFRGDYTHHVTGTIDLYQTTILEGGAVIKFSSTNTPRLNIQGTLDCQTSRFRPAVFTAKDDNSVGENISGSSGTPGTTAYATYALRFLNTATGHKVENIRIRNATYGVAFAGTLSNAVANAQFVRCQYPLSSSGTGAVGVFNALVDAGLASGHVFSGATTTPFVLENGTIHNTPSLLSSCTLNARNSLLAAITTVQSYTGSGNTQGNFQTTSASGLFQTVLAGNFYLASGSPHRNAGITGINSTLAAELKQTTTYPPVEITTHFTSATTLAPQAPRDTDLPDRGYHYSPVDYILSGRSLSGATLILTNGVSVAAYGASGISLGNNATFVSEGRAERMNRILRYQNIQEQPTLFSSLGTAWLAVPSLQTTRPTIRIWYTEMPTMGETDGARTLVDTVVHYVTTLAFKSSHFGGTYLRLSEATGGSSYSISISMNNCLSERGWFQYTKYYLSSDANVSVSLWNNLFRFGDLALRYDTGSITPLWTVQDNAFDNMTVTRTGSGLANVTNFNNAYINASMTGAGGNGGNNVTLGSFTYSTTTGGLGRYYHGQTNLLNAGSRTAASAQQYHNTTETSRSKEAATTVDIGFHYVATDSSGVPLDNDGDGIPDYVEDRNGNNSLDSGETGWTTYNSANGFTNSPAVLIFTPLK